jgi:hypothetical protein
MISMPGRTKISPRIFHQIVQTGCFFAERPVAPAPSTILVVAIPSMSRPRFYSLSALALGCALLGACQTTHKIEVDALSRPEITKNTSYKLVVTNPEIDQGSLRHREAVGYIKKALAAKGMYEAPDSASADMAVTVDYGMSAPKSRIEQVSHAEYKLQPGAVYTATIRVGTTPTGQPIFQNVVVQDPSRYVYVGDQIQEFSVVTYEKHLSLSARENKANADGGPAQEVWAVDLHSEGSSRDLRKTLPVLAAAAIEYIGKETNGAQSIKLKEDDGAVEYVKQSSAP